MFITNPHIAAEIKPQNISIKNNIIPFMQIPMIPNTLPAFAFEVAGCCLFENTTANIDNTIPMYGAKNNTNPNIPVVKDAFP